MANIRGDEEDREAFWKGFGITKKESTPKYKSTSGVAYFVDKEGVPRIMRWDKGLAGKKKNVTIDDEPWDEFTARTGLKAQDFKSISYDEYIHMMDQVGTDREGGKNANRVWE
jgi:hypothetical protein